MNKFVKAERSRCKIKMAVQGASGSGKTFSALQIAKGLVGSLKKVAVIDTENGSAHLYSELGDYSVLQMSAPFTPEKFIEAVSLAVKEGFECLVIDSLSAEWNGAGGILDIHSNIPGNSFTAWAKVTPRHNAFLQTILQSDIHVIATMRSKTDYVMAEKNGKQVPEKVGLKAVQREDAEYEFTLVLELNQRHQATVSKDRTGLFKNKPELLLTPEIGEEIAAWCNKGVLPIAEENVLIDFEKRINQCNTVAELIQLHDTFPNETIKYREQFLKRKNQLSVSSLKLNLNGVHH